MSDNPSDNNAPSMGQLLNALLPYFKEGEESPSTFSAEDMNKLVRLLRGVRAMKFNCTTVDAQEDGSYTPTAGVKWGDENLLIDLGFPPGSSGDGGSSVQLFKVISYSAASDYVVCQLAVATASNAFSNSGSNINVALPFKLRPYNNTYSSPGLDLPYVANDIIIATQPTGGTGVFVSGSDVGWVDVNYDGRQWQNVDYFNLVTMFANYFTATSILSGNTVAIAKNPCLRNSIASEPIDSLTWTYTYQTTGTYAYVTRKAVNSTYTEYQVISPRYLTSDIIMARRVLTGLVDGSSNPINWQEETPRKWLARASQTGYENT